jgi:hypothetical protein
MSLFLQLLHYVVAEDVVFESEYAVRFFGMMAVGKHAPKHMVSSKGPSITLATGTKSERPSNLASVSCGKVS